MKKRLKLNKMQRREELTGYLFASPWIIGFLVFMAFPILASLYMSFTKYNLISAPQWVGLANYKNLLFRDAVFVKSLKNTLYYVIIATPINLAMGVLIAMLLNQKVRGIRFYRTVFYLPNVVSMVAIALLWQWILDPSFGLVNTMLEKIGIDGPSWLFDAQWSKPSLILMGMWNVGGSMVIYLAALQDIPASLYEAATIDGAGAVRKFFKITLPLLSPSIFFNFVMGIILGFQVFMQSFIMTGGGPMQSTYFYAYYLYDKAFTYRQMGSASSMAWILLIITFILTFIVSKTSSKWVYYQSGDDN